VKEGYGFTQEEIDEIADRLEDAADDFRDLRRDLIARLVEASNKFQEEMIDVADWVFERGLIDDPNWVDEEGEPFLWTGGHDITVRPVESLGTMFRERVASLTKVLEERLKREDEEDGS
jgi:hypothetical protein